MAPYQSKGIRTRSSKGHSVNWRREIDLTLMVTGWTMVELAEHLGVYVQPANDNRGRVAPQIYAWRRRANVPPYYLKLALERLREHYSMADLNAAAVAAFEKEYPPESV